MAHLSLHLLGEPTADHAGQRLRFPTRKTLALLTYLAVEEGMHSRETLTALFWPDSNEQQGRAALRNTLNYLRHALDDRSSPHLLIAREALGLDRAAGCMVDVWLLAEATHSVHAGRADMEAFTTVLTLYRGDFLAGFSLGDAPEWEEWTALQRERWHQQVQLVCERLAARQRATGKVLAAAETLRRWIAINPLHEPAYQQLLQLYLATGDRDAVRRTYEACSVRLLATFGAEPSAETRALAAAASAARVPSPVRSNGPAAPGHPAIPLVGRAAAYLQLIDYYSQVQTPAGALVVSVEGEAGAGKTRLVNEFLDWAAAQGADVLRGRAFETAGRLPYQPLIDAFRVRVEGENAPDDLLADVWLMELSRLLPELRERYPDLSAPSGDDQPARSRLYEALARLGLALAARCPVILFIDDLQWADDASLDVLHYLERRWSESSAAVLLLLAVHDEALHPRSLIAGWLVGIEREGCLRRLPMRALAEHDTIALVQRLMGMSGLHSLSEPDTEVSRAFGIWLHRESAGLPFFVTELLKLLLERGLVSLRPHADEQILLAISPSLMEGQGTRGLLPPGVRDVIRARLLPLDPDTSAILVAGAVLGRLFTFEQLCGVAEIDERAGLPALDALLARHLLQPTHDEREPAIGYSSAWTYLFSHDKIRDVVYTEAGDTRRRLYHRRALAILERSGAPAAELARHALAAGAPAPAFRHSVAAGDAAMRLPAVHTAVAHYEQARLLAAQPARSGRNLSGQETARIDIPLPMLEHLLVQLGRGYELLSRLQEAQQIYEALLALAHDTDQPGLECIALNRLATLVAQSSFDLEQSRALLEAALHLAERSRDTSGLAETEWNLAQVGVYSSDRHATLLHGQRALALARELGQDDLVARSLNVLALGHSDVGGWRLMQQYAEEAAQIYTRLGNRAMEADSLALLGNALVMSGDTSMGISAGRRALAIAREIGSPWGQVSAIGHLTVGLVDAGAYTEALSVVREGVRLARTHPLGPMLAYILAAAGDVERALRLLDQACATHLEALAADEVMPTQPFAETIHSALCADYAVAGDWERANIHAHEALVHRKTMLNVGLTRWYEAEALLRGGDDELARADTMLLVSNLKAGADSGSPRFQIPTRRCLAVLSSWAGDEAAAIAHLQVAEALAVELELPGEQWLIAARLAELYSATGERDRASEARERAADMINVIAERIDDPELLRRFLAAAIGSMPTITLQ